MEATHSVTLRDRAHTGVRAACKAAARDFQVLPRHHPDRRALESFIAARYAASYGANVTQFAEQLVGLRHDGGGWSAGLGYSVARSDRLFIEQYLDRPVEDELASKLGTAISRAQIVEVGNLAAASAGAARRVIVHMTRLLHELGRSWVVFTSTRVLLNSFERLEIATIPLAAADPARLADGGESWGTYYAAGPQVMAASIPLGFAHLRAKRAL